MQVGRESFVSYVVPLPAENGTADVLLQRSLDKELAPYLRLERFYLILALLVCAFPPCSGYGSRGAFRTGFAAGQRRAQDRGRQLLTAHRREQKDEIGSLAAAFNQMSDGLAERDRVRDLLGKVVSPAVAAELLRKEVTLGGEEREVTVLFSDLRSFTSMSEASFAAGDAREFSTTISLG